MGMIDMDVHEMDELLNLIQGYGDTARRAINDVLHGEGAEDIKKAIVPLIPVSGRRFKGHSTSARSAMPSAFWQGNGMLSVEISARGKYGYLYFPDDGSNTMRHAGEQHFMEEGAEIATNDIIEECQQRVIDEFGG